MQERRTGGDGADVNGGREDVRGVSGSAAWRAAVAAAVLLVGGCAAPTESGPVREGAGGGVVRREAQAGRWEVVGWSAGGRAIRAWVGGTGRGVGLIVAGIHGDEPQSVHVAERLIGRLGSGEAPGVVIVPCVNPDGYEARCRLNGRGVDLNRNFPTGDWATSPSGGRYWGGPAPASEPETRAVMQVVERFGPRWIVAIHTIGGGRECNNFDGPGREEAEFLSEFNGLAVREDIGYATPGSLGTWAGRERGIAVITLELPDDLPEEACWSLAGEGLEAFVRAWGEGGDADAGP